MKKIKAPKITPVNWPEDCKLAVSCFGKDNGGLDKATLCYVIPKRAKEGGKTDLAAAVISITKESCRMTSVKVQFDRFEANIADLLSVIEDALFQTCPKHNQRFCPNLFYPLEPNEEEMEELANDND